MAFQIKNTSNIPSKINIDLDGPDGNAYFLLGIAKRICDKTGIDFQHLRNKMMSGDYGTLLIEIDKAVGKYINFHMSPHVFDSVDFMEFKLHFFDND